MKPIQLYNRPYGTWEPGEIGIIVTENPEGELKSHVVEVLDFIDQDEDQTIDPQVTVKGVVSGSIITVPTSYIRKSLEQPPKNEATTNECKDELTDAEKFYNFFAELMHVQSTNLENMMYVLKANKALFHKMEGEIESLEHVLSVLIEKNNYN
jgi:hypothetical protein